MRNKNLVFVWPGWIVWSVVNFEVYCRCRWVSPLIWVLTYCVALACVIYHHLEDFEKRASYFQKLLALEPESSTDGSIESELLFGRSGFLYSLLFVDTYLPHTSHGANQPSNPLSPEEDASLQESMDRTFDLIIANGLYSNYGSTSPLMYVWHDTCDV